MDSNSDIFVVNALALVTHFKRIPSRRIDIFFNQLVQRRLEKRMQDGQLDTGFRAIFNQEQIDKLNQQKSITLFTESTFLAQLMQAIYPDKPIHVLSYTDVVRAFADPMDPSEVSVFERYTVFGLHNELQKANTDVPPILYEISEIIDGIYLGGSGEACDKDLLDKHGINTVLNCTKDIPNFFEPDKTYMRVPINDAFEDIYDYFAPTFEFIDSAVQQGKPILVHCFAGISRSVTMVVAYLIVKKRMTLDSALQFVISKRSCACPNLFFIHTLKKLEQRLLSVCY